MKRVKLADVLLKTQNIKWAEHPNEQFSYIDLSSVSRAHHVITSTQTINAKNAPSRAQKKVQAGDIIFGTTRPTLSRFCIVPPEYDSQVCSTGFCVIRADTSKALVRYIYYNLMSRDFLRLMEDVQRGTSYPAVTDTDVKGFEIPLPTLDEQQAIVETLDDVFEKIDQAILLTTSNHKNSIALFDLYRDEMFNSIDKKYSRKLGEVCEKVEYGSSAKSKHVGKVPVVRMGNIQQGGIDWGDLVYSDSDEEIEKYRLNYNDVLFNRTNSPELVGKSAIYKGEAEALFAGYLIRIHRKANLLDADYLNHFLNSTMAKNYGTSVMSKSINQANINGTKLKSYPIPVPPLKDQEVVAKKLDRIKLVAGDLQRAYSKKLSELAKFKDLLLDNVLESKS